MHSHPVCLRLSVLRFIKPSSQSSPSGSLFGGFLSTPANVKLYESQQNWGVYLPLITKCETETRQRSERNPMRTWLIALLAGFLVASTSCTPTNAQTIGEKGARMSKIGPELISLYEQYSAYVASHNAGTFRSADRLVRVVDDRVVIDAVAADDVNALKADLVSLGMQQAVAFGRIVSGQLPISAIPAMAKLPGLNFARAAAASMQRSLDPLSPMTPNR